jgi:hypothetical protein
VLGAAVKEDILVRERVGQGRAMLPPSAGLRGMFISLLQFDCSNLDIPNA